MPKFSIAVTVIASVTYTVEVDACSESKAEDVATGLWRSQLPDDFQVDKGYITAWDAETAQLTWECAECSTPISEADNRTHDEMCAACFAACLAA
jgi:hypothetical protein